MGVEVVFAADLLQILDKSVQLVVVLVILFCLLSILADGIVPNPRKLFGDFHGDGHQRFKRIFEGFNILVLGGY